MTTGRSVARPAETWSFGTTDQAASSARDPDDRLSQQPLRRGIERNAMFVVEGQDQPMAAALGRHRDRHDEPRRAGLDGHRLDDGSDAFRGDKGDRLAGGRASASRGSQRAATMSRGVEVPAASYGIQTSTVEPATGRPLR